MCRAGTLFRNYFVHGGKGQLGSHQINTLADVEAVVDNARHGYWVVQNGYCLPVRASGCLYVVRGTWYVVRGSEQPFSSTVPPASPLHPQTAAGKLLSLGERLWSEGDLASRVHDAIRVGVHWWVAAWRDRKMQADAWILLEPRLSYPPTPWTAGPRLCTVSSIECVRCGLCGAGVRWFRGMPGPVMDVRQLWRALPWPQVFCSAVPVAYVRNTRVEEWEPFAQTVLNAAYDSTLLAASVIAKAEDRRVTVFLTMLGAGAFELPLHRAVRTCSGVRTSVFTQPPPVPCPLHTPLPTRQAPLGTRTIGWCPQFRRWVDSRPMFMWRTRCASTDGCCEP
jgi:hypothetical protein